MTEMLDVTVTVNGMRREGRVEGRRLLSDFIREGLGLTGTHVGCEHGVCGACTILLDGQAVRSCLMFATQANGAEIETIEGLASSGKIARLQALFSEHHALQCGYCTAGMLIIAYVLIRHGVATTQDEIRDGMSAAICRCTGYQGIIKAVSQAAAEARPSPDVTTERAG